MKTRRPLLQLLIGLSIPAASFAAPATTPIPASVQRYLAGEVEKIEFKTTADLADSAAFAARIPAYRKEFLDMLGLDPMPARTALNPVITGVLYKDDFTVEKIHFQSSPGLYVTGNLFIPNKREGKLLSLIHI